jgi:hypothetical protein
MREVVLVMAWSFRVVGAEESVPPRSLDPNLR